MNFTIEIPGLKDVKITKIEEVEERIAIHAEMPVKLHKCPSCGERTKKIHDYRIQKIKHLKWFERLTYLFYKRRRYACPCGKRFAEKNPFVQRYKRLSIEWNRAVAIRTVKAKTFKEVAEQFGSSISTVMRRFDQLAVKEMTEVQELPRVIANDEYKGVVWETGKDNSKNSYMDGLKFFAFSDRTRRKSEGMDERIPFRYKGQR